MNGFNFTTNPYQAPAPAPGSATATNPFLNLGLNAFQQTQQPFDTQWLDKLSNTLYDQANYNYNTNLNPTIRSNAIRGGALGGSDQQLSQGVVMDRLNQNVINAMAPQYVAAQQAQFNRALQGGQAAAGVGTNLEQLDLSRMMGTASNELAAYNAETQRQLGAGGLGLGAYNAETTRQLGMGDLGVRQRATDIAGAKTEAEIANPQYTSPWGAAIGGGLGVAQLLNILLGGK